MSGKALLDLDDDSFMEKFILPENKKDHGAEEKAMDLQPKPYIIIHPSPGVCVKTKTESGDKVFINVCTSEKIPAPEEISDAKLLEVMMSEDSDFCVPMSIGNERLEANKSGNPCTTYDVVLNKGYFDKCQRNANFWMFTITIIIEAVSNKFNKALNGKDFVTLKNRKVLGKLEPHRIEDRQMRRPPQLPKPLIEELPSAKTERIDQPRPRKSSSTSNFVILRQPREGSPANLIGLFRVPEHSTMANISVDVGQDRVAISTGVDEFTYDVFIPYIVQDQAAKAVLYKDTGVLRLDMPVDSSSKS